MAKKGGLGRGLDALLGGRPAEQNEEINSAVNGFSSAENRSAAVTPPAGLPAGIEVDENGGLWVSPNLLIPNPKQPRKDFRQKELEEYGKILSLRPGIEHKSKKIYSRKQKHKNEI